MKQILILAHGSVAKRFLTWVAHKRVADNRYTLMCIDTSRLGEEISRHLTIVEADPTSYARVSEVMRHTRFNQVFVVMDTLEDLRFTLQNVRMIDPKVLIVTLNLWEEEITKETDNIAVLDVNELMAAHLYDHLPNVPLVAQNVGLGQGEIMEILVPFGSAYAFRHVGSILQRKWRIAALYRDDKLILPTNATMIRPNDSILAVGKPLVLDGIYKAINKRIGLFPEPFGKDLYLLLDFKYDKAFALRYIEESIYLTHKLQHKHLYIRVLNPGDFALLEKLKAFECDDVTLLIEYDASSLSVLEYDISKYDVGLVLCGMQRFKAQGLKTILYDLRKLVYLFGKKPIYNVERTVILMDRNEVMESISATAFDLSEALDLELCLCDFDPEGEFESKKMIVEHYETLSEIFSTPIQIKQQVANPVRELSKMDKILQVAPYDREDETGFFLSLFSTDALVFLMRNPIHPKLFVPFGGVEPKEET